MSSPIIAAISGPLEAFAKAATRVMESMSNNDAQDALTVLDTLLKDIALRAAQENDHKSFSVALQLIHSIFGSQQNEMIQLLAADNKKVFSIFVDILDVVVVNETASTACANDLLDFAQVLACAGPLKERFGSTFIPKIAEIFSRSADCSYQRNLGTLLTNLVKQSKANKNRLGACTFIIDALVNSGDFFFQLQCMEILYRIHRHDQSLLVKDDEKNPLPAMLREGLQQLQNNENLVTSMGHLLDAWNKEENREERTGQPRIFGFDAVRADAGRFMLCGETTVYFSKRHLILMIPESGGMNVTCNYENIKQIRFGSDNHATFTLYEPPEKLKILVADVATQENIEPTRQDMEKMDIQFTAAGLMELRKTPIHSWIHDALQRHKAGLEAEKKKKRKQEEEAAATAAAVAAAAQQREQEEAKRLQSAKKSVSAQKSNGIQIDGPPAVSASRSPQSGTKKQGGNTSAMTNNAHVLQSNQDELSSKRVRKEEQQHQQLAAHASSSSVVQKENTVTNLRSIISDRVAIRRQRNTEQLNATMLRIQHDIDEMKLNERRDRDHFETTGRQALAQLFEAESLMKEQVTQRVGVLSAELVQVQDLGNLLREKIDQLEVDAGTSTEQARKVEADHLRQLKSRVDQEMRLMEATLSEVVSAANPVRFLTSYVSRKLEEDVL